MSKVLGIDYGIKRIGLAISDDGWQYAFPRETFEQNNINNIFYYLKDLCEQEEVKEIVLGMPLDQHGRKGQKAREVEIFGSQLKDKLKIPVYYQDERFTSAMAKKLFYEAAKKHNKNKGLIDQEAAKIILQSYLDQNKNE